MASHFMLQGAWSNAALYLGSIKEYAGGSDEFCWNYGFTQVIACVMLNHSHPSHFCRKNNSLLSHFPPQNQNTLSPLISANNILMSPLSCPHSHAPTLMSPLSCPHSHRTPPPTPQACLGQWEDAEKHLLAIKSARMRIEYSHAATVLRCLVHNGVCLWGGVMKGVCCVVYTVITVTCAVCMTHTHTHTLSTSPPPHTAYIHPNQPHTPTITHTHTYLPPPPPPAYRQST